MRFPKHAEVTIAELLSSKTSTTLALAIRVLPAPLRQEVSIAHLLFRVTHILEHKREWTPDARVAALREVDAMLAVTATGAPLPMALACAGDDELLLSLPLLLRQTLSPAAWGTIIRHARRAIAGIIAFSTRQGGVAAEVTLHDNEDARRYAYVVAGVFGELITELFVEGGHVPRSSQHRSLWSLANAFGEGLELSMSSSDCRAEIATIANEDLADAERYVKALRQAGATLGVVGYAHLPIRRAAAQSAACQSLRFFSQAS